MKATQKQYEQAIKHYDAGGASAVFAFAEKIGIDSYSYCRDCEEHTPDCHDDCCLVCGIYKPSTRQPKLEPEPEPETIEHGIRRVVIEHKVEQIGNTAIKFPARILPAKEFGEDFDKYEGLTLRHEEGKRDGVWVRYSQTFLYTRKSDEQLLKEFN